MNESDRTGFETPFWEVFGAQISGHPHSHLWFDDSFERQEEASNEDKPNFFCKI